MKRQKPPPSAAALLALAQENGITLTAEQAVEYFVQLHSEMGALSDEELDNVAGGCFDGKMCSKCYSTNTTGGLNYFECHNCGYSY